MKKLVSLALVLLAVASCQAPPSFRGLATPAAAVIVPTPTRQVLPPPSTRVLGTYMLSLDDVPEGYAAAETSAAPSLEEAFGGAEGMRPAATASVAFRPEKLDVLALFTRPAMISQTAMWYHNSALAQAAYRLAEGSARDALATEWGAKELETVPLTLAAENSLAYRASYEVGALSGVAYLVVAHKGPFVTALFVLGTGTGLSEATVGGLAQAAVAGLPG